MSLDVSKFTAAVAELQAEVTAVAAVVTNAAADDAAAQKALDDGVTALNAAKAQLAALVAPPAPPAQ